MKGIYVSLLLRERLRVIVLRWLFGAESIRFDGEGVLMTTHLQLEEPLDDEGGAPAMLVFRD